MPARPAAVSSPAPPGPDPEEILAQALRAMAGGRQRPDPPMPPPAHAGPDQRHVLSIAQIVLLAITVGLVLGMAAGLLTLLR